MPSHRTRYFNYASPGGWFITINSFQRQALFGAVSDGKMNLSPFGEIVQEEWLKSAEIRPEIALGEFVIMPDHFHALLYIRHIGNEPLPERWNPKIATHAALAPEGPAPRSLGAVIGNFKAVVSKRINRIQNTPGRSVWQKNYYERHIKSEEDEAAILFYIRENPKKFKV